MHKLPEQPQKSFLWPSWLLSYEVLFSRTSRSGHKIVLIFPGVICRFLRSTEASFAHALGCKPLANLKECHRHPITLSHSRAAVVVSRHKAFESRPPFIDQPARVLWSRATVYIMNAYSARKSLSKSFGVPQRSSNES